MTKILAFDTATTACSAALSLDGEIIQQLEIAPRRHGELLLPMIDRLLRQASLCVADCDAIAFGNGPGSFMGLRIAAGMAQGLALGADIPLVPVSSLQALAQASYWQMPSDKVLAGWDARMQQIYWGIYQADNGRMEILVADQLTAPEEVYVSDGDCIAAGNAWSVYADTLPKNIATLSRPEKDCYPTAKAVAFLAAQSVDQGNTIAAQSIELSYLRNKVAEKPNR